MREPRALADLPYASYLERHDEEHLRPGGDYNVAHVADREFPGQAADNVRFSESALAAVKFTDGSLRRSRFNDVWLHGVQVIGTDLAEGGWLDAEVVNSAFAGVAMFGSGLSRVTFFGCKLVSVNLRGSTLREVAFVDCVLRDVDFTEADLTKVSFPGSTLEDIRFDQVKLTKVDLRDAAELGIRNGFGSLRGATITSAQALDLAPSFAQAFGIVVEDR
ncbi:pentapeptide repeat-containing protein [Saccharothrix sp. HUAS TT1]|uniref:pentapeptide repeat-containing protein n=1 Tax=unclassified Saccharothrix TaxID=2593673 RepID=UPI00345B796F